MVECHPKSRLFAISDIHIDYKENKSWLTNTLENGHFFNDGIIVAGDITHKLEVLEEFFVLLLGKFQDVFFVPGNHELWIFESGGAKTSIEKFNLIIDLCTKLGVHTSPKKFVNAVWVVPLFSWYHPSFSDNYPTTNQENKIEGWSDFYCCKWPQESLNDEPISGLMPIGTPDNYFLKLNEVNIHSYDAPVITFSHFLPREECLPPTCSVWFLPYVSGSKKLDQQLRTIESTIHIFGHTHINYDFFLDGVRYIQNSRKYPREQKRVENVAKSKYHKHSFDEMIIWEG